MAFANSAAARSAARFLSIRLIELTDGAVALVQTPVTNEMSRFLLTSTGIELKSCVCVRVCVCLRSRQSVFAIDELSKPHCQAVPRTEDSVTITTAVIVGLSEDGP